MSESICFRSSVSRVSLPKMASYNLRLNFLFSCFAGQQKVHVFTATDFMLFDTNDLLYFEVLRPKNISYIYKVRPAKDFGGKFVSIKATVSCCTVVAQISSLQA